MTTKTTFSADCNHTHRNILTAARCLRKHVVACEKAPGNSPGNYSYSNRSVSASDRDLTANEQDTVEQIKCGFLA